MARLGVGVGILGFWTCATVGAAAQPGYDPTQDYLSSLAASGAAQPGWGLAMFAFGALALGSAAVVVRDLVPTVSTRARTAAMLLAVSAGFVLLGGLARVECIAGAAGCNAGPLVVEQITLASRVHAGAVAAYQLAFSAGLLSLAWAARRAGVPMLAALSALGALLTPLLGVVPTGSLDPGTVQRVWVATGHAVVVALAAWPRPRP
jgi:hypothetical protein